MAEELTICGVGDILLDRDEPETMFAHTAPVLRGADITFAQLEQVLTLREEAVPSTRSPARAHPNTAKALKAVGFDILSFASNHGDDYGISGFLDTVESVKSSGITLIGAGKNIAEARQPAIFEEKGTRVGFLAYNTIVPKGYEALAKKPGVVPLRAWTSYQPIEEFQPGTPCRILTFARQEDLEAMKADIRQLRPRVDVLIVSMHWGLHHVPASLAMYQFEMGHAAIDEGADLILGHHAHILKPIEVYKGKVIFFSLGNFAIERSQKEQKGRGDNPEMKETMTLYSRKTDPEYPTYPFHPESRKTMIAKILVSNKRIRQVSFLPVLINKKAEPELVKASDPNFAAAIEYMQKIDASQNLKTLYRAKGDEVIIEETA